MLLNSTSKRRQNEFYNRTSQLKENASDDGTGCSIFVVYKFLLQSIVAFKDDSIHYCKRDTMRMFQNRIMIYHRQ